jgi:hypothetical protein
MGIHLAKKQLGSHILITQAPAVADAQAGGGILE